MKLRVVATIVVEVEGEPDVKAVAEALKTEWATQVAQKTSVAYTRDMDEITVASIEANVAELNGNHVLYINI